MTPAQQTKVRIAIAEWRGWRSIETFEPSFSDPTKEVSRGFKWYSPRNIQMTLPDYCNDLNACHGAEKGLTPDQRRWFCNNLRAATSNDEAISATALQRAEALYRTIKGEAP